MILLMCILTLFYQRQVSTVYEPSSGLLFFLSKVKYTINIAIFCYLIDLV